jgi:hypothetical protein
MRLISILSVTGREATPVVICDTVTLTLSNRIWEVLFSNLERHTCYPDRRFYGSSESLQTYVGIISLLGHRYFLQNSFSSAIIIFDAIV